MPARRRKPDTLIGRAWEEYILTKQTATGNGELYIPQLCEVPGWFPAVELGMALEHGPSIAANLRVLAVTNKRNRRSHEYLEARDLDRPKVVATVRRMSPDESRSALRAKLREVGFSLRGGKFQRARA